MQLNSTTLRAPAVPSHEFNAALEYTLAFGRSNSTNRTDYETDTAKFWYDEDTGETAQAMHVTAWKRLIERRDRSSGMLSSSSRQRVCNFYFFFA